MCVNVLETSDILGFTYLGILLITINSSVSPLTGSQGTIDNNSQHLLSTYCVPYMVLCRLHSLSLLINNIKEEIYHHIL